MIVRRCQDIPLLRTFLSKDPGETAYALGDLAPQNWRQSAFWGAFDGEALRAVVVFFYGFEIPVITMHGDVSAAEEVLSQVTLPGEVFCLLPLQFRASVSGFYNLDHVYALKRMLVTASAFRQAARSDLETVRLTGEDTAQINTFYKLAAEPGEELFAFSPEQVQTGVFYGAFRDGLLMAAAGTHIVSVEEGIAAVGNILTRNEARGSGLGTAVTQTVTAELLRMGVKNIVLNVKQTNVPAIRVYEKLGYRNYCDMLEGPALLKTLE